MPRWIRFSPLCVSLLCVTWGFFRHTHAPGRAALDRVRSASRGARCCPGTTPSQRGRSPGRVSGPNPNNLAGSAQLWDVLSTHQQRKGKKHLPRHLHLRGKKDARERAKISENLAFSSAFSLSGTCRVALPGTASGVHPLGICRGTPRTRDTALVCFSVSCTHKLELVQTLERMRRVQFTCPFLPRRGAAK